MSAPESEHKVYIYTNDYNALCTEVYRHQQIETGGNLFGLWTTSGSAVIHVVLGPGKYCRRTDTSFHQDIEYMKRVGSFVNEKYMLCHIGEWHSHHCLSLSKPSRGDELTIERNFPRGMTKFLVIIANIKDGDQIVLSPYFFTHDGKRYEKAVVKVLESDSPFSSDIKIKAEIAQGAETTTFAVVANNEGSMDPGQQNGNASPTRLQHDHLSPNPQCNPVRSESQTNPSSSHSNTRGDPEEQMDTTESDLYRPSDYPKANSSSVSATSPPQVTTFPSGLADPNHDRNSDDKEASEKHVKMKKIHDELKKWFGNQRDSIFELKNSKHCPNAIEIKFKHEGNFWMVRFPADFPTSSAKLFCSVWEWNLHRSSSECEVVQPLNNEVNVLLSVKKRCRSWCSTCKNFSKELLSVGDLNPHVMEKLQASIKKVLDEVLGSMDADDLKMQCLPYGEAEITFEHSSRYWIINFPAQFPNIPAKVYYMYSKGSSQRLDAVVHSNYSYGQLALNSAERIIKAIYLNCGCMKCGENRRRYR